MLTWIVEISGALAMKEGHFLSKNVFCEKMFLGISDTVNVRAFKHLPMCSASSENFLVGISGVLKMKESHFLMQKCVLWKCWGVSQIQWMLELSDICHWVQHLWKLTSRHFWSSKNERKPLSQQKYILRKCWGVSQHTVNARAFKHLPLCSVLP